MAKSKQSQETQELNDLLKEVLKTQKQINDERIKDLDITRSINDEINDGLKSLGKENDFKSAIRRSLKEINKLSEQNFDLSELDLKLSSNKEDISKRQQALSKSQNTLLREQAYVDQKINTLLNDKIGATKEEEKAIDAQIESFKKVQNGLTEAVSSSEQYDRNLKAAAAGVDKLNKLVVPDAFKGLSEAVKDIPGLRKLSGPFEAMSKASKDTAARLTSINIQRQAAGKEPMFSQAQIGLKSLSSGFSALGPIIKSALGPIAIITTIASAIKAIVKLMFEADQQVTDIAKNFNISKDAARDVRDRFFELSDEARVYAGLQENQILLQKELVESNIQLNNLLGTAIDYTTQLGERGKETVAQFAAISKFLKLSEDEQRGLLDLQQTSGESIKDIKDSVLGSTVNYKIQKGILLDERKILKDVLTASNAIKLTTKGGLDGLTKSVIEAQKLGVSLQKVSDISSNLLNFEESISAELEAELLTGRDLNLETARAAALNGDLATVAKEVATQIGSAAEFSKMNVIQQESLAKSVGLTREELADTLVTQERLNKLRGNFNALGKDQLDIIEKSGALDKATIDAIRAGKGTVVDYYNALKSSGKTQEEINKLLGDQASASLEAQSAQDKFNDSLEKAKQTFTRFIDGGSLDKLANFISDFVNSVGKNGLFSTLMGTGMEQEKEAREAKSSKSYTSTLSPDFQKEFEKGLKEKLEDPLQQLGQNLANLLAQPITTLTSSGDEARERINNQLTSEYIEDFKKSYPSTSVKAPPTPVGVPSTPSGASSTSVGAPSSISVQDYVIKSLPQDTVVGMGGTKLGRTDEMVKLLTEQNKYLAQLVNKEGTITLNGTKMGTAMAVGSYKTQ
jgi:hypothetical protein